MKTASATVSADTITGFRYEREMFSGLGLETFRGLLAALDVEPKRWFVVVQELSIYGIIPDILVASSIDRPSWPVTKRLSFIETAVLAELMRRNSTSQEHIQQHLYVSESVALRTLTNIMKAGFAIADNQGRYKSVVSLSSVSLLAVEFKLKRWREALRQAAQYREFADDSYVILDSSKVETTQTMLAEFRSAGVGLILQRNDNQFKVALASKTCRPVSAARIHTVQRLLALPGKK